MDHLRGKNHGQRTGLHRKQRWDDNCEAPAGTIVPSTLLHVERGLLTSPDVTLTASSYYIATSSYRYHGPQNSKLYTQGTETHTSAWSSEENKVGEYIEADLRKIYSIKAVATQGRAEHDQWITIYYLKYSTNGVDWTQISSNAVFVGNSDRSTIKKNPIGPPISARYVRLYPLAYHGHMSLRWELFGTGDVEKTPHQINGSDWNRCEVQEGASYPFGDCSTTCGQGIRARVFFCTFPNNGTTRFIREEELCNADIACPVE